MNTSSKTLLYSLLSTCDFSFTYSSLDCAKKSIKKIEVLAEELEESLDSFSDKELCRIEEFCEKIIVQCRKKDLNPQNHKWRRRLRYAAGFILNIIDIAREEAAKEEEDTIYTLAVASQSALKDVWND